MDNIIEEFGGGHGVKPIPTVVPTPTAYEKASEDGFRALCVIFALMLVSTIVFTVLSWNVPIARRAFHVFATLATITGTLAYFAMASGHTASYHCTTVRHHHKHHLPDTHQEVCREVYWARYVNWAITTPLLILNLTSLAGAAGAHTLMAVVASEIMSLTYLFATFGRAHTAQKWGWYAISVIAYIFTVWHVGLHGTRAVKAKSRSVARLFGSLSAYALILWAVYHIVWGIAEGSRRASVDAEIIAYGVLDVLSLAGFGLWLLLAQRRNSEAATEIGGYWSNGPGQEGRIRIGEEEA